MLVSNITVLAILLLFLAVLTLLFIKPSDIEQSDNIPGPFLNRFTNLPLKIQVLKGNRVHYVHELHQKYGPCIRLSPTEVAISDIDSVRQIHRIGGGFLKSLWYQSFTDESSPGMFAMTNPKAHAVRRKLFSNAFSQNSLLEWEGLLHAKVEMALTGMKNQSAAEGSTDILQWWTFMATDVIGELGFGESFRALEHGKKSVYSRDLETTMFFSGIRSELPLAMALFSVIPIPAIQTRLQAPQRLEEYGSASIKRNKALAERGEVKRTLFSKMLQENSSDDGSPALSMKEIEREAGNLIVAGSDTTAVTLTYLIWAVLKHPTVRERLMSELSSNSMFSVEQLKSLSYFSAVIQEVLRLYGAAPASLPRIVPKGGRNLAGFFISEGMTVSTQAWTNHRDGTIFYNPEEFIPERWLNPSQDMKDAMMPFGGGSRICIGLHLAQMELAISAARFLTTFPSARIATSMKDEDMLVVNYFLITPRSHKCRIVL